MGKPRFARQVCGRESLSVNWIAVSILVLMQVCVGGAWAQAGQSEQDRVKAPVVQYLMDVGTKQYQRGSYEEAEKTLLMAQGYQQYLTAKDRLRLEDLMSKAHQASLARKEGLECLKTAETLVAQNKAAEAMVYLQRIKDNKFLPDKDRRRVAELLGPNGEQTSKSDSLTDKLKKNSPFNSKSSEPKSSDSGANGQAQGQPRPAEDTLSPSAAGTVSGTEQPAGITSADPLEGQAVETGQASLMDDVKRKRSVIRDHVRAVVSDTRVKVGEAVGTGKFDGIQESIEGAKALVETNRQYLGQELVQLYTAELAQMEQYVAKSRQEAGWQTDQQKRSEAVDAERRVRQQQDVEKQKAIIELMERAKAYRDQQRYEAALAQVDAVLARDPVHDEALRLKRQIEDLSHLRKQIDIDRDYARERANTSLKVDEAQVPYAEEMTYAKNWREINAKPTREADRPVELDPANMQVYKQLDQTVDLSTLNPQMPLSEAVDRLRNAVTPPLRIVVLWNDLANAASPIQPSDPIGLDGLPQVRLGTALESLLAAVSGGLVQFGYPPLGYMVDGGIIRIATLQSLPKKMETRIYDISDLITEVPMMSQMNSMQTQMRLYQARSMFDESATRAQDIAGGGTGGGGGTSGGTRSSGLGGGGSRGGGTRGSMGGGMMGGMGMGGMGGGMMGGMGGGMMGGMGMGGMGMGGMGMGGMGMGGMGGGMGGGYGGGMGGMGGGMGGRGGSYDMSQLTQLIENTIAPDSWYDTSDFGEGMIVSYPQGMGMTVPKKLAITQSREVHKQIEQLLDELRKSLGPQVSIEARFLTVSKGFMEEIGLDADITLRNLGGKWGNVNILQDSVSGSKPSATEVPGSMGNIPSAILGIGSYGGFLDDLQVDYLLRATQARNDTKTLSSPRATVMSGEPAVFNLSSYFQFALPPETSMGYQPGLALGAVGTQTAVVPQYIDVITGNSLQMTPTISKDKKHVLLTIDVLRNRLVGIRRQQVETIVTGATGQSQTMRLQVETPETEAAELSTRVSVPDGGTLLLGGQTVTTEVQKQVGVPILSKIPVLGRLFSSESTVKDQQILLLLVKPTIILQHERDLEAIAEAEAKEAHAF